MNIISNYNIHNLEIGTVCSHSALQIFHGAKKEGFKTLGLTLKSRKDTYESFLLAKPDIFFEIDSYDRIMDQSIQDKLIEKNVLIIPHGSFVEYIGTNKVLNDFYVPMFGNKRSLEWESSREKVDKWMRSAGLKVPKYKTPDEIDSLCIVKMGGAKGGRGFFLVKSEKEFYKKLREKNLNQTDVVIQEYIVGVRYYHHFFNSVTKNRTEFLGVDQRLESNVDGLHRIQKIVEPTYTVTGNAPVILRESLIPTVLKMGSDVVKASRELFSPGMTGPFCIETICTENLQFYAFEISARIVAGTNLYPNGSQYSTYYFDEPMSTGRRIAREIKEALHNDILRKIVS